MFVEAGRCLSIRALMRGLATADRASINSDSLAQPELLSQTIPRVLVEALANGGDVSAMLGAKSSPQPAASANPV